MQFGKFIVEKNTEGAGFIIEQLDYKVRTWAMTKIIFEDWEEREPEWPNVFEDRGSAERAITELEKLAEEANKRGYGTLLIEAYPMTMREGYRLKGYTQITGDGTQDKDWKEFDLAEGGMYDLHSGVLKYLGYHINNHTESEIKDFVKSHKEDFIVYSYNKFEDFDMQVFLNTSNKY